MKTIILLLATCMLFSFTYSQDSLSLNLSKDKIDSVKNVVNTSLQQLATNIDNYQKQIVQWQNQIIYLNGYLESLKSLQTDSTLQIQSGKKKVKK